MSAECEIHGTDLVGNEWSEGGLVCPVCEVKAERDRIKEAGDELAKQVERILPAPDAAAKSFGERYTWPRLEKALRAYRSASPTPDAEEE